jgi:hypothetical protein
MKKKIFDFKRFELAQIIDALTCPLNRFATMEEHKCDEWYIHKNPHLLIEHYIRCGGAEEFSKKRDEFFREIDVETEEASLMN